MLESLGVDYSNIMTEADMEPILQAAKEKYPDVYPLASDSGAMGTICLRLTGWEGISAYLRIPSAMTPR